MPTTRKSTPDPTPEQVADARATVHDEPEPGPADHGISPNPEHTVHQAMAVAMRLVRAVGKTGRNAQQGYAFRSIDVFMTHLNPAMAAAGVHVIPTVLERLVEDRTTGRGTNMRLVDLRVAFTFYGPDGSSVQAITWGEGTDAGDKATNKAMTGAFKYAIMQAFMVPTEDLDDADRHSPDVPSRAASAREQAGAALAEQPEAVDHALVAALRAKGLRATALPMADRRHLLQTVYREAQQGRVLQVPVPVPEPWQAAADGATEVTLGALLTGCQRELPAHGECLDDDGADPATGEVLPEPGATPGPPQEDEQQHAERADRDEALAAAQARARHERRGAKA